MASRSRIPSFVTGTALQTSQHSTSETAPTSSSTTPASRPLPIIRKSGSYSPLEVTGSPSTKSTISKIKGTMSSFSKHVKPPQSFLPGPSKSFCGTGTVDSVLQNKPLSQGPKFGSSGSINSSTPVANSAASTVRTRHSYLTPPSRMSAAQSSPQINSIPSAPKSRSIPPPLSFRDLKDLQNSSPNFYSVGSRLYSTSQSVVLQYSGNEKAKASASQGDLTQISTHETMGIANVVNTPPRKPPRPSLLKTPLPVVASIKTSSIIESTLPGSSPMSKRRGGDRFVDADGGGEGNTGGTSSTLVGIYSKRQRRISELRLSPALAFGTRATEYRICRKLATSYPSSDPASRPTAPSSSSAPSNSPATSHGSVSKFQFSAESKTFRLATRNFTRIPISRTGVKDSPKSLQTSPSGSKSSLATPTTTKADSNTSKRQSFVETIAETIVPQYTQGALFTPTLTPSGTGPLGDDRFGALQTAEALRTEVKDLNEKLEVLKAKRAADQDKLREVDRLKLQVETLVEFKTKVLENQGSLQKELKKAKQDARDAIVAKEQHAEEMADLSEAVEMATLDKEMAEEKSETLQMELEQANEKIAQLSTELTAIKDELSGNIDPDLQAANSVQMKQLHGENARMREALLKLRDSASHDKHQHQKLLKEAETHKADVAELSKMKERLEKRCEELEAVITDLQEMNDAALGAEEMVVNLTEKNLNLEEKVTQLAEAVADLEALQDVNDQLQESAREVEMELRDEFYRATVANSNITREKEALIETLTDREATIVRFRELVQKLRDENDILRKNLEEESSKSIPGLPEALDFKKIFSESKAQTTAIDLELRRIEAKEAALHATYLSSYMPDGFMKRGGDNDAVLVLLLVPRMICKVELLLSQVRDKLTPASFAEGGQPDDQIASSPDVERYAFSCQFSYLLYAFLSELHRWSTALNGCSTDDFLNIGLLLTDLSVQEKALDFYLELLRKSQLDENIPLDGLEKCISSFQSFYSIHLGEEQIVPTMLVSDLCLASAAASDCLIVDVARLIHIMKKNAAESNVGALLQDVKTIGESLRQLAKRTRRYLPDLPKQPPVSNKLQSQLLNDAVTLTKVVKVFQEACKQTVHHAEMLTPNEGDGISSSKVEEYFQSAMEKCDTRVEGAGGFKEVVKEWLTTALMTMTDLAQVVNEAPVIPKEKPPTPLSLRAQAVKAELDQSRNLRIQLDDKETTINELRKVIRAKQEEFSEANIRKELAEKKLSNATKDSEMTIEKLSRKLEDSQTNLQRREREFQATLEHFQSEIEAIENEKGELKEKLMTASKRRLLDGIANSAASSPVSSPAHGIPVSQVMVMSSSTRSEVMPSPGLMEYTRYLQRQNWKLRADKVLRLVRSWEPIKLPKREDYEDVKQIHKDFWKIKHEANGLLCEELRVKFNDELTPGRKRVLIGRINLRRAQLNPKIAELGARIDVLLAEKKEFGFIKRDFATFSSSSHLTAKPENTETVKVGMLRFPGWEKSTEKPRRIVLSPEQLQRIHDLLAPIG